MKYIILFATITIFTACSTSTENTLDNSCSQCNIQGNWHLYSGYSENNQNVPYDEFSTIGEEINHVEKIRMYYSSNLNNLNISSDPFFSFDEDCTYNLSLSLNGNYSIIDDCTELRLSSFDTNVFNEYTLKVYENYIIRISSIGLLVKI